MTLKVQNLIRLNHSSRLKFLLRDSVLYGGASALAKAFGLITFPLLARHFSVTEYGVLDYFFVLAGFLSALFIFGQDSAVARYFYESEDADTRRQFVSQSLVFQLVLMSFFLPLLWFAADWLTEKIVNISNGVLLLKIALLQVPFLLLINFSLNLLKWTLERSRFMILSLGSTAFQTVVVVVAVLRFKVGIIEIMIAGLCTSIVFGLVGVYFIRDWLVLPKSFERLWEMLPFAIPYGVICLLGAFTPMLERTFAFNLVGPEALGEYVVAAKISMLIGLAVGAFQTAWGPFSLALHKSIDAVETYNLVLKLCAFGAGISTLIITLLAKPLVFWLASPRYSGGTTAVFPLVMALAIQATSWVTEIGIGFSKKSHLGLYAYLAGAIVSLLGMLTITPSLGLLGIAFGVLGGQFSKAIVASYLAQRAYPLQWHYSPMLLALSLTMTIGIIHLWTEKSVTSTASMIVLLIGLVIQIWVGLRFALSGAERRRIVDFLYRVKTPGNFSN